MEFSKKMLVLHSTITVLLIIAVVAINVATEHDVTALAALAGTSFVVDGTWGGFYLWKSKNENRRNMPKSLYASLPRSMEWTLPSAWLRSF